MTNTTICPFISSSDKLFTCTPDCALNIETEDNVQCALNKLALNIDNIDKHGIDTYERNN